MIEPAPRTRRWTAAFVNSPGSWRPRDRGCWRSAHALVFAGVYWLAYLLRFDFKVPADSIAVFWSTLAWVIGLKLLVFYLLAQFQGWWRYVTFADLAALVRATIISLLLLAAATSSSACPSPEECSSSTAS